MVFVLYKWEFLCKMIVCDLLIYFKYNNYIVINWEKKDL